MSTQMNVQEAKTQLSRLLALAESGEEVVIARGGVPIVRLSPIAPAPPRELGFVSVDLPDSFFFDPLPQEELDRWA